MSSNKKFCKICFDSNKPESEYTSHCVKGRTGKVECPTLLKVKCRLCDQFGHTVKYCQDTQKSQPKNIKSSKSENLHTKSENLHTKSENLHTKSENLHTKSENQHKKSENKSTNFYELLNESDEEKKPKKEKLQIKKRWIDYDSDSDEELQISIPIPPILRRRSSHASTSAYDSLEETDEFTQQYKFILNKSPPSQNPVLKRNTPQIFYDSSDEEQCEQL